MHEAVVTWLLQAGWARVNRWPRFRRVNRRPSTNHRLPDQTADSRWPTKDGRLKMADSRWPRKDGRLKMADSRWPNQDGRLKKADSRWPNQDGRLKMADSRWPNQDGRLKMADSRWLTHSRVSWLRYVCKSLSFNFILFLVHTNYIIAQTLKSKIIIHKITA